MQASLLKHQQLKCKHVRARDVPVALTGTGRCASTGITAEVKRNMTRQIQEKCPLIQILIEWGPLVLNGGHTPLCNYL